MFSSAAAAKYKNEKQQVDTCWQVSKKNKTTKSMARSLCFSSTRDILLRIQSRFSQRRFQLFVEKLGSPGGWWKYYKYSQVRIEREECADRNVCTFCLDSQDLGSPDSNKHHLSLNVWTSLSHWVILLSLTATASTCLILRPWTRSCRDTWGLGEDCRFAAACRQKRPSVLQAAAWRHGAGRRETTLLSKNKAEWKPGPLPKQLDSDISFIHRPSHDLAHNTEEVLTS